MVPSIIDVWSYDREFCSSSSSSSSSSCLSFLSPTCSQQKQNCTKLFNYGGIQYICQAGGFLYVFWETFRTFYLLGFPNTLPSMLLFVVICLPRRWTVSIHSCGRLYWPVLTRNWSALPEEGDMTFDLCSTTTITWSPRPATTPLLWADAGDLN